MLSSKPRNMLTSILVFVCNPNPMLFKYIYCLTNLFLPCNSLSTCLSGAECIPRPRISLQNHPLLVWTILVSTCVSTILALTCSGNTLSCWDTSPTTRLPTGLLVGCHTFLCLSRCTLCHVPLLCPSICIVLFNYFFWHVFEADTYVFWPFWWCHQVKFRNVHSYELCSPCWHRTVEQHLCRQHARCWSCHFSSTVYPTHLLRGSLLVNVFTKSACCALFLHFGHHILLVFLQAYTLSFVILPALPFLGRYFLFFTMSQWRISFTPVVHVYTKTYSLHVSGCLLNVFLISCNYFLHFTDFLSFCILLLNLK